MKSTALRTLLVAPGLAMAIALTGCGGASEPTGGASSGAPSVATSPATTPSSEPSSSSSPSASTTQAEQTEVKVGKSFTDPDTKDKVEIVSVIRNFPSKEKADDIADGGEVVLVQVKVTPGQEYGGAISEGNFQISWDSGKEFWMNKTRMVEDEMKAAKKTPFDRISRRDGGSKTGWIAYVVEEKAATYKIEYKRPQAKVIGSDKVIKEFKTVTDIPAA